MPCGGPVPYLILSSWHTQVCFESSHRSDCIGVHGVVLLNTSARSCLFHGAIGPATGRGTVAGAAVHFKAKSGWCHPLGLRFRRLRHWQDCRMTTSDFKKLKGSCQQTNVSLGLGEMEYVYSISQLAKYLSVYSLHASAKNRRTPHFIFSSLHFHECLSGFAAVLAGPALWLFETSLARCFWSPTNLCSQLILQAKIITFAARYLIIAPYQWKLMAVWRDDEAFWIFGLNSHS